MKEKPAQVAKRLAKTRGYSYPEWEYLAEKDPVFLDAYNRLSGLSLLHEGFPTKGKQLPAKYRELVAIAAMIGQSRMWGVKPHMERALRLGCTEQELLEALETALTPVGSPPFRQAINILMQVTDWKPGGKSKQKKNAVEVTIRAMRWLAGGLLWTAVALAAAQPFPNKGIRVVVPYPPGGFNDVVTRVLAQGFSEGFAPGSYADNKPGAGTVIGTELVAKSAPDGYTILVVSFPFSVMNALYPSSKVDVVKDFAALSYVGYAPSLLVANSATPYKSVGELIEAAKAKPATLLYASTSNGSSAHLFMELFKSLTGASLVHVPYKGNGPAMVDLLGGHVPIMFANLPNGLPHVQSGKLRALAITAPKRIEILPDVPTMGEAGVNGFEANTWWGAVAPAATPKDVIAKLNAEINRILGTAEVRKLFQSQDVQIAGGTTDMCADYIRSQVALWSKVVREAKIKAE